MKKRLLLDRCLTGRRHPGALSCSNMRYSHRFGRFPLLDRCLTGQPESQVAEKRVTGLLRGMPVASVVKECLSTAEGGQWPGAATVKESLTVQNGDGHSAHFRGIAELERIEKQLEQKKARR